MDRDSFSFEDTMRAAYELHINEAPAFYMPLDHFREGFAAALDYVAHQQANAQEVARDKKEARTFNKKKRKGKVNSYSSKPIVGKHYVYTPRDPDVAPWD